jgi:hypothetical protein
MACVGIVAVIREVTTFDRFEKRQTEKNDCRGELGRKSAASLKPSSTGPGPIEPLRRQDHHDKLSQKALRMLESLTERWVAGPQFTNGTSGLEGLLPGEPKTVERGTNKFHDGPSAPVYPELWCFALARATK